jgi:hypothetical protein
MSKPQRGDTRREQIRCVSIYQHRSGWDVYYHQGVPWVIAC